MDKNICLKYCNGTLHYLMLRKLCSDEYIFKGFICNKYWQELQKYNYDKHNIVNYELDKTLKPIRWITYFDYRKKPLLLQLFPNIYINHKLKSYKCFNNCPYKAEHDIYDWNNKK